LTLCLAEERIHPATPTKPAQAVDKLIAGSIRVMEGITLRTSHKTRVLFHTSECSGTGTAVRMRPVAGRAIRITSRIVFFGCGLISLLTGVPYAMLRGVDLPVQSEWVIFVVALALMGLFSLTVALLPRSAMAKVCRKDRDDERLFSTPLKLLGGCAAISYLLALVAYFAPHNWDLNPQLMLALCPMYLVKMTFDPSPISIFLLLAPMNAAVYGSLGVALGYAGLAFRRRR
jgi:hypothetical protein